MYLKHIAFSGGDPRELQEVFDHVLGVMETTLGRQPSQPGRAGTRARAGVPRRRLVRRRRGRAASRILHAFSPEPRQAPSSHECRSHAQRPFGAPEGHPEGLRQSTPSPRFHCRTRRNAALLPETSRRGKRHRFLGHPGLDVLNPLPSCTIHENHGRFS